MKKKSCFCVASGFCYYLATADSSFSFEISAEMATVSKKRKVNRQISYKSLFFETSEWPQIIA